MQQTLQTTINLLRETSQESCEEIYFNRWADIQFDGTLEAVDHGIEAMVYLAQLITQEQNPEIVECAAEELECTAYWTACNLRTILAFYPTRCTHLTFNPSHILNSAIGQYLPYLPKDALKAINLGVELATKCTDTLPLQELSECERDYRTWVTPHLINHLVFSGYIFED